MSTAVDDPEAVGRGRRPEVVALDHATMLKEAEVLRKIADNVCIKVPLTIDGLKTCRALTPTGSFMPTRVCDTKAGWAAFDGHNRQGAAQFRDALRMTGTNERQGQ